MSAGCRHYVCLMWALFEVLCWCLTLLWPGSWEDVDLSSAGWICLLVLLVLLALGVIALVCLR